MKYDELPEEIPIGKAVNIIGQRFNQLIVLYRTKSTNPRKTYFVCKCDCGEYTIVDAKHLKDRHTKSCGCLDHPDLTNKVFEFLTVIKRANEKGKGAIWECKCKCGKITYVRTRDLLTGHTKSCGCRASALLKQELVNKRFSKLVCIEATNKRSSSGGIIWKCKCDCGNIIEVAKNSLITANTQSCGCLNSKGELRIQEVLLQNNIKFEKQKTFQTCIFPDSQKKARFDFYLSDYNVIIEYDGEQHYMYQSNNSKSWNTKDNYEKTKQHDEFKNQWCVANNIKIKRIPYWDFEKITIEYILDLLK